MQTIVFTENAATLRTRLEIDPLLELLREPIEVGGPTALSTTVRSEFFRLILSAHNGLLKTTEEGGAAQRLAEVFGLDLPFSSQTIELLISALSKISDFEKLQQNLGFIAFYSSLKQFQSTVDACVSLLQEERIPLPEEGAGVLELEVPADADYTTAEKFGEVVQQMVALHAALARCVLGRRDDLAILYLDSGGPLLVGFQFDSQLVQQVREMFASAVWGVRFNKNERFELNVDSAVGALDVFEQLEEAVGQNLLSEEDAEVAKRAITRSMKSLLAAGASPRNLILEEEAASEVLSEVREPLMLEAGEEDDDDGDSSGDANEQLRHLVWRRRPRDPISEEDQDSEADLSREESAGLVSDPEGEESPNFVVGPIAREDPDPVADADSEERLDFEADPNGEDGQDEF